MLGGVVVDIVVGRTTLGGGVALGGKVGLEGVLTLVGAALTREGEGVE